MFKYLFTIIFSVCFVPLFAQNTDTALQRMIDSMKNHAAANKPATTIKDTSRKVVKVLPVKKDSGISPAIIPIDSLAAGDSTIIDSLKDSLHVDSALLAAQVIIKKPLNWQQDTAFMRLLNIDFIGNHIVTLIKDGTVRMVERKDFLFYLLLAVVLLLAIIRQLFPKYLQNVFHIMFQASFRQKQTREQLMQETLPSLLMNILFVIVCGLFIAILAYQRQWLQADFWQLSLYSITVLALAYMFKYLIIQFMGWAFQAKEPAAVYGFIVFMINKVIGLALLPLLLMVAFSSGYIVDITVTVAAVVVILLFLFRYIVSLTVMRGTLQVHPIHFFIYLCAVEIVPMLIIYKVLFSYVGKSI
ncbi:DUF4271 domain-containing protein [Panacibacter sp. KCS-6]|uniref:DUF4271 domain-containing protein n=2 Tax=Limnovirga soli TaxID=2656915 RepID=A0A8J8JXK4_9BACT|nr:DUF4271 domain-containing protein [Limnovirga soli]